MLFPFLLAAQAAIPAEAEPTPREADGEILIADLRLPPQDIVVTASRTPVSLADVPVSGSLIADPNRLALPFVVDELRHLPGVSVSTVGSRGSQTQLRIRGAEANHTLLFVDGIRFNDPAAGNEPRFELFTADGSSRVELIRGPQSALWGSEALGGVVAIGGAVGAPRVRAEYGELDSRRFSVAGGLTRGIAELSGHVAQVRSDGIDATDFDGGDRDGFENDAGSLRLTLRPGDGRGELGIVGHYVQGESRFDGTDPVTFLRADTSDTTRNRIGAVRGHARVGENGSRWHARLAGSYLRSSNRNQRAGSALNRTRGERFTVDAQVTRRFGDDHITVAVERESEAFAARDQEFFGATDQDRDRSRTAAVAEWRARWGGRLVTDVAVRHDAFSAFRDATTVRAAARLDVGGGSDVHAAYGEGIAQPTFFDLFGFFPGSFVGNPDVKPERAKGVEAGVRYDRRGLRLGVTGFAADLRDEIVTRFVGFSSTTANAPGESRRRGVELEAGWTPRRGLSLDANYTFLDAEEGTEEGSLRTRELRRPRHSANLVAAGEVGPARLGLGLAYVGARVDQDFDLFPAPRVRLDDYLLGTVHVALELLPGVALYGRVENAFDARREDAFHYATEGRTVHAGLRLGL
ncbi:MAG: hypothetical protein AVDCRST_MAG39-2645 [uncultured Sphingomonadaceae bacterium]|uniref:TonB-dependent receptor n=1 Tax=uncultured Sphingomonadaceae bacterium TaxID=169976 RepID=A0A6J4TGY8_9SPHN|nr:MAG: hypothetical protein AVDCRST_MAG39-2645 [uncultured Sphingomonadaceae bacterium]